MYYLGPRRIADDIYAMPAVPPPPKDSRPRAQDLYENVIRLGHWLAPADAYVALPGPPSQGCASLPTHGIGLGPHRCGAAVAKAFSSPPMARAGRDHRSGLSLGGAFAQRGGFCHLHRCPGCRTAGRPNAVPASSGSSSAAPSKPGRSDARRDLRRTFGRRPCSSGIAYGRRSVMGTMLRRGRREFPGRKRISSPVSLFVFHDRGRPCRRSTARPRRGSQSILPLIPALERRRG